MFFEYGGKELDFTGRSVKPFALKYTLIKLKSTTWLLSSVVVSMLGIILAAVLSPTKTLGGKI